MEFNLGFKGLMHTKPTFITYLEYVLPSHST